MHTSEAILDLTTTPPPTASCYTKVKLSEDHHKKIHQKPHHTLTHKAIHLLTELS